MNLPNPFTAFDSVEYFLSLETLSSLFVCDNTFLFSSYVLNHSFLISLLWCPLPLSDPKVPVFPLILPWPIAHFTT